MANQRLVIMVVALWFIFGIIAIGVGTLSEQLDEILKELKSKK